MATSAVIFEGIVFADDLNAWRALPAATAQEEACSQLRACQSSLRAWDRADRVAIDACKEPFRSLVRTRPAGDAVKILSVVFDPKFVMPDAVESCVAAASLRNYNLVRARAAS